MKIGIKKGYSLLNFFALVILPILSNSLNLDIISNTMNLLANKEYFNVSSKNLASVTSALSGYAVPA